MTPGVSNATLRLVRQSLRLSLVDMAVRLGTHYTQLQRIESKGSKVPEFIVLALYKEFGITPNQLFGIEPVDFVELAKQNG